MAKSSDRSGPFSFPLFPDMPQAFLPLPQMRMNGGLPISPLLEFARSQARAVSKCSSEIARFAEKRFDRDEQLLSELASCEEWNGVAALQAAWTAEVLKDYMEETGQIMQLLRGIYSEMAAPVKKTERAAKKTERTAK